MSRDKSQEKVFTRLCNTFLSKYFLEIKEGTLLTGALDDGKILWHLLSSISGKTLPKLNENPKFRIHKLENLSISLKFLEQEKIKLIGIAQEDILDHNPTLILGLIWTIVLRFQISKGSGEKESMKDVGQVKRDIMDWFSEQTKNLPALPDLPSLPPLPGAGGDTTNTNASSSTAPSHGHVPLGSLPSLPGLPPLSTSGANNNANESEHGSEEVSDGSHQQVTQSGTAPNGDENSHFYNATNQQHSGSATSNSSEANLNENFSAPPSNAQSTVTSGNGDAVSNQPAEASRLETPSQLAEQAQLQHAKSGNLFGTKSIDRLLINLINSLALNSIKESEITHDVLSNTQLALDVAYEKFGIPKIVDAEDICSDQRDDKILITYLSLIKDMKEKMDSTGIGKVVLPTEKEKTEMRVEGSNHRPMFPGCELKPKETYECKLTTINVTDPNMLHVLVTDSNHQVIKSIPSSVVRAAGTPEEEEQNVQHWSILFKPEARPQNAEISVVLGDASRNTGFTSILGFPLRVNTGPDTTAQDVPDVDWFVPIYQPANIPHFVGVNRVSTFTVETNSTNLAARVKIYYTDEATGRRHELKHEVAPDTTTGKDSLYEVSFRLTDSDFAESSGGGGSLPKSVTIEVEQQRFDVPLHPEVIQLKRRQQPSREEIEREQEMAELRMFMSGDDEQRQGIDGTNAGQQKQQQNISSSNNSTTTIGKANGANEEIVFQPDDPELTFEMDCNCDSLSDISFFLVDTETHERYPVAFQHVPGSDGRVRFDFQAEFPDSGKSTLVLNARSEIDETIDCEALRVLLLSADFDDYDNERQRLEEARLLEERLAQGQLVQELLDLEFLEQEQRSANVRDAIDREQRERLAQAEAERSIRRLAEEQEREANEAALRELMEQQQRLEAERLAREQAEADAERREEERLQAEIERQERETRELEEEIERERREIEALEVENEKLDVMERERLQRLREDELRVQREKLAAERAEKNRVEEDERVRIAAEKEEAERQMRLISKRERNNQLLGLVTSEEQKGQLEMSYSQANPKNKALIKRFQKEKESQQTDSATVEGLYTRIIAPSASFVGQACYFSVDTNQIPDDSVDAVLEFSRSLRLHVTEIRTGAQCDIHIDEPEEGVAFFIPEIYFVPSAPGLYLLEGTLEDIPIEGCPFQIDILASPDERPEVGDKIRLEFTHELPAAQLHAHVADADGKHVPANVSDSGAEGIVAVTFVALSKGQHNVQLMANDNPMSSREVFLEVEVSPCLGSDARIGRLHQLSFPCAKGADDFKAFHIVIGDTGVGTGEFVYPCTTEEDEEFHKCSFTPTVVGFASIHSSLPNQAKIQSRIKVYDAARFELLDFPAEPYELGREMVYSFVTNLFKDEHHLVDISIVATNSAGVESALPFTFTGNRLKFLSKAYHHGVTVSVKYENKPVLGFPHQFSLLPLPTAKIIGFQNRNLMVGHSTSVLIETVNVAKDELEILVKNAKDGSVVPHSSIGLSISKVSTSKKPRKTKEDKKDKEAEKSTKDSESTTAKEPNDQIQHSQSKQGSKSRRASSKQSHSKLKGSTLDAINHSNSNSNDPSQLSTDHLDSMINRMAGKHDDRDEKEPRDKLTSSASSTSRLHRKGSKAPSKEHKVKVSSRDKQEKDAATELLAPFLATYSIKFTPKQVFQHNIEVRLRGQHVGGSPLHVQIVSKPSATLVLPPDVKHGVFLSTPFRCLLSVANFKYDSLTATLTQSDGTKIPCTPEMEAEVTEDGEQAEHHDASNGTCALDLEAHVVGPATLEVLYPDGSHVLGSPATLKVFIKPWAKVDVKGKGKTASKNEQFYFQIIASPNVEIDHFNITAKDEKTKKMLEVHISQGDKQGEANLENEDHMWQYGVGKEKYFDVYWIASETTTVFTKIMLAGQVIAGAPFRIQVQEEHGVFANPLDFSKFITMCNGHVPISEGKGVTINAHWQSRNNVHVPLAWTCCIVNDLGEVTESLLPGHVLSKTGAVEITRHSRIDGNVRKIYIRPYSLRVDTKAIVIVLSCLSGDFTQVKKLIFTFAEAGNPRWDNISFCMKSADDETMTSCLFGIVAQSKEETWTMDPIGIYAAGRVVTDFIPNLKQQISAYTPIRPALPPFTLERGMPCAVHPKIQTITLQALLEWEKTSRQMSSLLLVYDSYDNLKMTITETQEEFGIKTKRNKFGQGFDLDLKRLPKPAKCVILAAFPMDLQEFKTSNRLVSLKLKVSAGDVPENPAELMTSPRLYDHSSFFASTEDVGPFSSLLLCKLFRRNSEAPWELVPFGAGKQEKSLEELLSASAVKADEKKSDEEQCGILPFLRDRWVPVPRHLKVIVLDAVGVTGPDGGTGTFTSYLLFEPAGPKVNNYTFENIKTNLVKGTKSLLYWGTGYSFHDVGENKDKELMIVVSLWSEPSQSFLGEVKVPLKKYFKESESYGLTCCEKSFKFSEGKRKVERTAKKLTGEVRLRFIAF